MSSLFPENLSEIGARVDTVQVFIILVMVFWFIACNAVLVYFMFRYKRKGPNDKVSTIKGNHLLEVVWTVIPTLLCLFIFWYGVRAWEDMRTMPADADSYVIDVTAQKWSWSFKYPNGKNSAMDLYVPVDEVVKLRMNSQDVLHSFFLPEFRIKEDVVPSYYTYLWFKADKTGTYNIFCTEYCGKDHSGMLGKIHVLSREDWLAWEADELFPKLSPMELGEQLYVKRTCNTCHSIDGSANIGPSFLDLYGRVENFADGTSLTLSDDATFDAYVRESINNPKAKIVAGYPADQMPAFEGQLSDEDMIGLITYIKSLRSSQE